MPARDIYRGNSSARAKASAAQVTAPVEYAVAVARYLDAAHIAAASRRVYRVALETWAWLLVARVPPTGPARRGATAPTLPLARLDGETAAETVTAALASRALMVDPRTFAREASILRNAVHWWAYRGWISPAAEHAIKACSGGAGSAIPFPPTDGPVINPSALFALPVPLREQTLWRLVFESAAPLGQLLALDMSDLDFPGRRTRRRAEPRSTDRIGWGPLTAELLPLLTIGRTQGPVFRTERRAPERVPAADRCPYTGRARLSARRAAELFESATRELDPAGSGWNLRDLRVAGRNR